jgi:hypothetical protein
MRALPLDLIHTAIHFTCPSTPLFTLELPFGQRKIKYLCAAATAGLDVLYLTCVVSIILCSLSDKTCIGTQIQLKRVISREFFMYHWDLEPIRAPREILGQIFKEETKYYYIVSLLGPCVVVKDSGMQWTAWESPHQTGWSGPWIILKYYESLAEFYRAR